MPSRIVTSTYRYKRPLPGLFRFGSSSLLPNSALETSGASFCP